MACRILLRRCFSSARYISRNSSSVVAGTKTISWKSHLLLVDHSKVLINTLQGGFEISRSKFKSGLQNKIDTILGSYNSRCMLHTTSPSEEIFNVQDEADFKDKVLNNKKTVIVEFHATWCGPCKLLMPRMEESIVKFTTVDMAKVDIDEHPEIAMDFNVGAVPSVLAMKNGEVIDKFVGLKDIDQIDTFITNAAKQ